MNPLKNHHRFLSIFAFGTIVLGFVILGLLAYWRFYPYQTIEASDSPFEIVYPTHEEGTIPRVRQGGVVAYEFTYIKHTDVIPTVQRYFVDGLVFAEGPRPPVVFGEGAGTVVVDVKVPRTLPPGIYRIIIKRSYQMNPIRSVENQGVTQKFIVEAADDDL